MQFVKLSADAYNVVWKRRQRSYLQSIMMPLLCQLNFLKLSSWVRVNCFERIISPCRTPRLTKTLFVGERSRISTCPVALSKIYFRRFLYLVSSFALYLAASIAHSSTVSKAPNSKWNGTLHSLHFSINLRIVWLCSIALYCSRSMSALVGGIHRIY